MSVLVVNNGRRAARNRAGLVAGLLCAALIGVTFLTWLTSLDARRTAFWTLSPGSGCVSMGRGGAQCPENPSTISAERSAEHDVECPAYGRAGRLCPAGERKASASNSP